MPMDALGLAEGAALLLIRSMMLMFSVVAINKLWHPTESGHYSFSSGNRHISQLSILNGISIRWELVDWTKNSRLYFVEHLPLASFLQN